MLGWRDVPTDPTASARPRVGDAARSGSCSSPAPPATDGLALERRAFALRKRPSSGAADEGARCTSRRLSARTMVYKGMLTTHQLGDVFPRPAGRAGRDRVAPRALPVLDEHVPVLAAGPPVPLHRPQRRDQHIPGNRNWMRAREALLETDLFGGDLDAAVPDLHAGRVRLGALRRGARAAAPGRPQPAARGADDDPGGVGEPRVDGSGPAGVLQYHAS